MLYTSVFFFFVGCGMSVKVKCPHTFVQNVHFVTQGCSFCMISLYMADRLQFFLYLCHTCIPSNSQYRKYMKFSIRIVLTVTAQEKKKKITYC